jgi:plastocyanin
MMPARARLALLLAGLLAASGSAAAAELAGSIVLRSGGQSLRASEAAEAVVYFRPSGSVAPPPAMAPVAMSTRRKEFVPRVLAITPGTEVSFPNLDPILHNAFSTSTGNQFDTGVYGPGDGTRHTFTSPGLVKVYCNVHHAMSGHILVLDTPHFVRPDAQGQFRLENLPDGAGTLVVFHDRANPWQQRIDPAQQAGPLQVELELTRRKVPPHMNKFGKPYGRGGSGY